MPTNISTNHFYHCAISARVRILCVLAMVLLVLTQILRAESPGSVRDAERGTAFFANAAAAELATETALAAMANDYPSYNSDSTNYGAQVPSASSNQYYQRYIFLNPKTGASNSTYITRTDAVNYGIFNGIWPGIYGFKIPFSLYSSVRAIDDPTGLSTAQASLGVSLGTAPIFQWAIFYNGLLEFSDASMLTIKGRVHTDSNIYVGSPLNLIFDSPVTSVGTISAPSNFGYPTNQWTGSVTYNASPAPGFVTNTPSLRLFDGLTNSIHEIIDLPPAGEDPQSKIAFQRLYNRANMTLMISNSGYVYLTFSAIIGDTNILCYQAPVTNVIRKTNFLGYTNSWNTKVSLDNTSSNFFGLSYWLSTNSFYDFREQKTVFVTDLNVGQMQTWLNSWLLNVTGSSNQSPVASKFPAGLNPFTTIYFADMRTNAIPNNMFALRLTNGASLPTTGLTVVTRNPLYIQGNYNCSNSAFLGTTNTTGSAPASVVCDALTILSPNWNNPSSSVQLPARAATSGSHGDTVNTAIIAGNVSSTGNAATNYSGGLINLPRLLEDWASSTLTLNTSFVCLFSSMLATNQYKAPGSAFNVYNAPQLRQFSFDQNYLSLVKLPPNTPNIIMLPERTSQVILSPGVVPP